MPTDCDPTLIVTCPRCGEQSVCLEEVSLFICTRRPASYYRFSCSLCSELVVRPATERVIALLMRYGTDVHPWFYPAEWDEPHSGAPISYDELLEFHFELEASQA